MTTVSLSKPSSLKKPRASATWIKIIHKFGLRDRGTDFFGVGDVAERKR